jgi:hypothetical protein
MEPWVWYKEKKVPIVLSVHSRFQTVPLIAHPIVLVRTIVLYNDFSIIQLAQQPLRVEFCTCCFYYQAYFTDAGMSSCGRDV